MHFSLFIFSSALILVSQSVIMLQSSAATTTLAPSGSTTLLSAYYNTKQKNAVGVGVPWITSSKIANPTIYQNHFYATCTGKATVIITAATSFRAYFDGVLIGTGSNYLKIYKFPIDLKCGNHNFLASVNYTGALPQGLTFAIDQDQSKCYKCQPNGFWNETSCACQCIMDPCPCPSPKTWKTYPYCSCACPFGALLSTLRFCSFPKYYSDYHCRCVCHRPYCNYFYDQVTCQCG